MSSSSTEHDNNIEMHDDAPSSPHLLSSPAECDISSDCSSRDDQSPSCNSSVFEASDHSLSYSQAQASPPTSPVRRGKKRPSYYGAYKDDPTQPIPRQTLDRWKKKRSGGHSSDSSDGTYPDNIRDDFNSSKENNEDNERECVTNASIACHVSEAAEDTSHQPGSSKDSVDQTCDLSQSSVESSESEVNLSNSGSYHSNSSDFNSDNSGSDSDFNTYNSGIDSDSSLNDTNDPFEEESLYPGCEKTKDEAIHELINIYLRKKLSKSALTEFLKLYVTSLPPNNAMPSSIHYLFQYVRNLSLPLNEKEHYYCRPSMHPVVSKLVPCDTCESTDIGIFYELPLDNILKFLFEERGLGDLIDSYSETRSQRGDNICDITDGSEYRRVWGGIVSKYKVTLILDTDGVSPHPSSKARFWPLMFTIMEVPPHLRSSFTIVWGIWFDKKLKPNMNLYLKPFVNSLVKIHRGGGVAWKNPSTGKNEISPVRAPVIVADAPARAAVLNMQEHQSKYACSACEQKTSKLARPPTAPGAKKKRRERRFIFKEKAATLRTNHRMLECGKVGTEDAPKRGMKGSTVLSDIPFLDLSTCVLAEYMHCVLSGVVRQICSLCFFEKGPWYIGEHLDEINNFLDKEIHPPDFVSRLPRSFEYFAKMKANEFRSFLLYFSLVVVAPYLKDEYLQHWMLFVQGIFLLITESISENNLLTAEALLRLFVRELGTLYGDSQYVYNVHQLLHLCLYVRRWGGLWSNAAFSFENMNGVLADMIHGSKNEGRELINQLSLAQGNQMLKNKINADAKKKSGLSVLGKHLPRILTELELNHLRKLKANLECLECYGRIQVGRETFSSQEYDKHFRRCDSYVEIKCDGRKIYGRIAIFCKSGEAVFCIVSVYNIDHTKFFFHRATRTRIGHIIPVKDSGDFIVCEAKHIVQKLIQAGDFLCYRPNSIERNL
ncbi:Halomucin [Frankliniella fusca]|uniref:Halomucin n=1 Tax=Frankliniella fusca TaxID=407009 RepID=A0AAE1HEJ3_9NEOP|nr:Halomucin [Frankliniella fusca]